MSDHEEESIYDREEEHEHTNECGHTDADHQRMNRLGKNLKQFLADNAADMIDEETFQKMVKKVTNSLKEANASASFTSLKIYREGFMLGMMAGAQVGPMSSTILAGIGRMIKEKEPKKAVIDITKSKPMKDEKEG